MKVTLPQGSAPVGGDLVASKSHGVVPAIDPGALAEAHRQLLADPTIQFELPPFNPPQPPQWVGGMMPLVQVLFWIAVGAIILFVLYLIVSRLTGIRFGRRRKREEAAAADESWRPEAAEARELLSEADALAAQGQYAEAAHLILFRSIEDIDDKRPDLVRPALTSRDICALEAIPPRPRSAFARIAATVERSLFAGRPLVSGDWSDCRAAYEEFAFAEGWRG